MAVAGLMLLAAFGLAPQIFEDVFPALGAGLFAFILSGQVFRWLKKSFMRPIILFDAHGVFLAGDLALDNFTEMPGTPALVERLRENYCVCLFTNMSPELFNFWNSKWKLTDRFDYVFVSGKIKAKKPDPHAFRIVVHQLGAKPSDIIFFDDIAENVESAASIGIKAVQFQSAAQAAAELRKLGVKV